MEKKPVLPYETEYKIFNAKSLEFKHIQHLSIEELNSVNKAGDRQIEYDLRDRGLNHARKDMIFGILERNYTFGEISDSGLVSIANFFGGLFPYGKHAWESRLEMMKLIFSMV